MKKSPFLIATALLGLSFNSFGQFSTSFEANDLNRRGNNSVYIGSNTGFNSTGTGNVFTGTFTGFSNTTGSNNCLLYTSPSPRD